MVMQCRSSATIGTRQVLEDDRGWRIIERDGKSKAIDLRKSVPIALMADSEWRKIKAAENRELIVQQFPSGFGLTV